MKPRIVIAGPDPASGGGVQTVIRRFTGSRLKETFEFVPLTTHVSGRTWKKAAWMAGSFGRLVGLLVRKRVELVHLHCASSMSFYRKSFLLLAAHAFRRPVILHIHGGRFQRFYDRECGPLRRRYVRWILNRADIVIALSESWKRELAAIKGNNRNIRVVMNPVKVVSPSIDRSGRPMVNVLFLGAIQKQKGVYDLLECARRLAPELPTLRFTLCGQGEIGHAKDVVRRNGLEEYVELPGWVSDPDPYLAAADMLVLPSYIEGLPMAVLEAGSHGLPVIATRVGGVPEVVEERHSGFLVKPGDIGALADRIRTLARNQALRQAMGEQGRAIIQLKCGEDMVFSQVGELYRQLLQRAD